MMNWPNVRLILGREIRDQLRDRRTLFMIAVLPILLYPLIGMTFLQIVQFLKEHPSRVLIVGVSALPEEPKLFDEGTIVADYFTASNDAGLIEVTTEDPRTPPSGDISDRASTLIDAGTFDAVVYFPPDFRSQLERFRESVGRQGPQSGPLESNQFDGVPRPKVFYNGAKDKSRIAQQRISAVLTRWRQKVVDETLVEHNISRKVTAPFELADQDVAKLDGRRAALWSKVLPFVLIIWALTGAFYPAIDLCAGEKERGTLETLLSSPAERGEIVWGKLLTIMAFSMATSLLNILTMGATTAFIVRQLRATGAAADRFELGSPPFSSMIWLVLALIPISALFSALSLALASMARSTKEGQYYLMPLLLVTMPLMMLPMLPATELNLGTSLIPVAGVMMLLRNLLEGEYVASLLYLLPVSAVTLTCCLLAIRWATDQFNNESVLFRESERLDLWLWIRRLVRDRGETPTAAEAVLCGVLLLLIRFFAGFLLPAPRTWDEFAVMTFVTVVAFIATPALLMAITLTRNLRKTLLLFRPSARSFWLAVLLAVCLHPLAMGLTELIRFAYPMNEEALAPLNELVRQAPTIWHLLLLLAFVPAICEEIAFRGFILSGLRHTGSKWRAILITSIFFGLAHGLLQQSIMAVVVGLAIGYVAVQTGSLLACIAFHFIHNSLAILSGKWIETMTDPQSPLLEFFVISVGDRKIYNWPVLLASGLFTAIIFRWLRSLPYEASPEERLNEALDHQNAPVSAP